MAKKPSKKKTEPKTDAKRNTSGGPKKVVRGKIETKTPPKAHGTGSVGTGRVTKPKAKPRAIAKTGLAGLNLKKAIVEVLDSSPQQPLSPVQVRILVMRKHINLGEVASLLDSLEDRRKTKEVDKGGSIVASAKGVAKSATRALNEVAEEIALARSAAPQSATLSSFGTTVDLEDAVLAVLCEEPNGAMTAPEVQGRSVRYLGFTPDLFDVILALKQNPKVTALAGDTYRGNCS